MNALKKWLVGLFSGPKIESPEKQSELDAKGIELKSCAQLLLLKQMFPIWSRFIYFETEFCVTEVNDLCVLMVCAEYKDAFGVIRSKGFCVNELNALIEKQTGGEVRLVAANDLQVKSYICPIDGDDGLDPFFKQEWKWISVGLEDADHIGSSRRAKWQEKNNPKARD